MLLIENNDRLVLRHNVSGQFRCCAGRDVLCRMDRTGGDAQRLAGLEAVRSAIHLVFDYAREDIGNLDTGVRVPRERRTRGEIDAHLDRLAIAVKVAAYGFGSGDALGVECGGGSVSAGDCAVAGVVRDTIAAAAMAKLTSRFMISPLNVIPADLGHSRQESCQARGLRS